MLSISFPEAHNIGARAYKECTALRIEGVDDVFEAATRASMLMREGVPTSGVGDVDGVRGEKHHLHKRKRSGGSGSGGGSGVGGGMNR